VFWTDPGSLASWHQRRGTESRQKLTAENSAVPATLNAGFFDVRLGLPLSFQLDCN
jgi:hypothetical protein